jgi:hypothetical protein
MAALPPWPWSGPRPRLVFFTPSCCHAFIGHVHQQTQGLIHGRRIGEGRRNVRIKEYDVASSHVSLVVLPPDSL